MAKKNQEGFRPDINEPDGNPVNPLLEMLLGAVEDDATPEELQWFKDHPPTIVLHEKEWGISEAEEQAMRERLARRSVSNKRSPK